VNFLIASQIALWIGLLMLGVLCIALARQVGVLHQRIAPAGALSLRQPLKLGDPAPQITVATLDGSSIQVGGKRGPRSQLLLFVSPDCTICEGLLPALRSAQRAERQWLDIVLVSDGTQDMHEKFVREKGLAKFPYVVSEHLGRSYGVAKLPYAVLIDNEGNLVSTGLVNTREHLESLFVAKETGVGNIQQFLRQRGHQPASAGE
jgi:methylamine dehydrogenase accessory protein MauD